MEKLFEELKKLLQKKYVANLLVVITAGILLLIFFSDFGASSRTQNNSNRQYNDEILVNSEGQKTDEEIVEGRLKRILQEIKGAGEVEVMITFEIGSEMVAAMNTVTSTDKTEEKDANGGTRVVTSESTTGNIATINDSSGNKPLVIKEIMPQIKGVIVVAEGADDIQVKSMLYEAVKTVLQVPGHKVQIYTKN
ncbi:stage III sporulation protein AG [Alkaliphilus serpentinus]|uniref:Stage III sporulation protein AG n=1 Tax=Alkaliphilus serpentinus TaxID=1482731 RepID=A0A833HMG8_9FIRM|nr:stage III sporulation protein AG [Alkaliphilus serpentinus]KAB3527573.1 stage III sporulation protein AG [Alkaliphilus serpentinus]